MGGGCEATLPSFVEEYKPHRNNWQHPKPLLSHQQYLKESLKKSKMQLTHRSAASTQQLGHKPAGRALVRARAVEAPAKLSATDRVKLGDSDLQVSGLLCGCSSNSDAQAVIQSSVDLTITTAVMFKAHH